MGTLVKDPLSLIQVPQVRDLAWAVASPSLVQTSAEFPSPPALDRLVAEVHWLNDDPSPLLEFLSSQRVESGVTPLGRYFEALWQFWFQWALKLRALYSGVKISNGMDLGELDVVFAPGTLGAVTDHWELAVKYYLCTAATPQAAGDSSLYYGMLLKDRLDKKLKLLREKQLPMGTHPDAMKRLGELGLAPPRSRGILKGMLFYPWSWKQLPAVPETLNPAHLRGTWCRVSELPAFCESLGSPETARWAVLPRLQWLAPALRDSARGLWSTEEFQHHFLSDPANVARRGRMLALLEQSPRGSWREVLRCIVVGDEWGPSSNLNSEPG